MTAASESTIRRDLLSTSRRHQRDGVSLLVGNGTFSMDPFETQRPIYVRSAYRPDSTYDPVDDALARARTWISRLLHGGRRA